MMKERLFLLPTLTICSLNHEHITLHPLQNISIFFTEFFVNKHTSLHSTFDQTIDILEYVYNIVWSISGYWMRKQHRYHGVTLCNGGEIAWKKGKHWTLIILFRGTNRNVKTLN